MKLSKLYVAVLAVAIGSTATVSAVAYQQQAVPTSGGVKSCPTSTVTKNTTTPSSAVEKAVSQALASAGKSTSCPQTTVSTAAAKTTAAAKASSGSSNCSNTAVKAQTTSTCPTSSTIPDLSAVLDKVSCKQAEAAKTTTAGSTVNVPNCFRQLLERCGVSVPDSLTSQKNCGNSGSSSSSKPSSSKPADSSSSQSTSSTPSSSTPASSKPSSSTPSSSTPSSSQSSSSAVSSAKPSDTLTYEERVVELVNQERAKVGLKPLTMNLKLSEVARAKSQDMHDKNYFSHTSPTYGSPFDMMKQFGITYRTAGENIAMGYRTPEAVMEGWMNSPGHKANILNSSYTEIGVGYVSDGSYWTQEFIG